MGQACVCMMHAMPMARHSYYVYDPSSTKRTTFCFLWYDGRSSLCLMSMLLDSNSCITVKKKHDTQRQQSMVTVVDNTKVTILICSLYRFTYFPRPDSKTFLATAGLRLNIFLLDWSASTRQAVIQPMNEVNTHDVI